MKLIFPAVLLLAAVSASAQGDRKHDGAAPAAAAEARKAGAPPDRAAAAEAARPPAASGALQFLRWSVGDKDQPGAFAAPALCTRLLRDISNANVGPRVANFRGLQFSVPFVRDALSNPKLNAPGPAVNPGRHGRVEPTLCADGEALGIPAGEVLPVPPQAVLDWLKPTAASGALYRYFQAAESEKDPHDLLRGARDEFFETAFAAALKDADAVRAFCAELEPANAGCPGELAGLTGAQLHARARKALSK